MIFIKSMIKIIFVLALIINIVDGGDNNDNNNDNNNSNNVSTYVSLVDSYKGIYRVISVDTGKDLDYENRTLYIKVGDVVIWKNYDDDMGLTIVSKEKLWKDKQGYLKNMNKIINYTFHKSGNYTFYIRQYPGKFQSQTIVVKKIISVASANTNKSSYIKSNKSQTYKTGKNSSTDNKTIIRIVNYSENNSDKYVDSKEYLNNSDSKFKEIFLAIMVACTVYIIRKFK